MCHVLIHGRVKLTINKIADDNCLSNLKIAVVHDWLITYGGAERVLEQILAIFPQADLFALYDFTPAGKRDYFLNKPVTTSFLQNFPFASKKYRSYLPFMPLAVEQFDLSGYDLVISSSHAVAHGVLTNSEQLHISYINNTMVYAWDLYHHYLETGGLKRGLTGLLAKMIMHYIRIWDVSTSDRVDNYVANSRYTADRISKLYGRTADVIYPPVEVEKFEVANEKENYYVTVARLVPFKRIDLIVAAFNKMPNRQLIILGDGPDMKALRTMAGNNIEFLGFQTHDSVARYVKRARGFLFSSVEPFGIALVEALASGTPVVAYGRGAAPEIVRDGENGVLFDRQDADSLIDAIDRLEQNKLGLDPHQMRKDASRFSTDRFRSRFKNYVLNAVAHKFSSRFSVQSSITDHKVVRDDQFTAQTTETVGAIS